MSKESPKHKRVLALDFGTRGFGYAVMEGPHQLIDWGVREVRKNKNSRSLRKVEQLIRRYQPDSLVLEDYSIQDKRRPERVRALTDRVKEAALQTGIKVHTFSRKRIKEAFLGTESVSRFEIATTLSRWFPELAGRLPPKRKIWMPEHPQMGLFDAVALAITYFFFEQ